MVGTPCIHCVASPNTKFFSNTIRQATIEMFELDVSTDTCPMTFVRTRLQLDKMSVGEVLQVRFFGDEPRSNLARSLTEQGHAILAESHEAGGGGTIRLRKGG